MKSPNKQNPVIFRTEIVLKMVFVVLKRVFVAKCFTWDGINQYLISI